MGVSKPAVLKGPQSVSLEMNNTVVRTEAKDTS
jgi:hypothetical protein